MSERSIDSGADESAVAAAEPARAMPVAPHPVLINSRHVARTALEEITDPQTIGADEGFDAHDEITVTLYFECRMPGYPGWRWAATLAKVADDQPVTVLEVELVRGEGSLTAPDWVPWSVRLAQYREAQAKQAADEADAAQAAADELSEEDDAEDDLLDNDFSDFDDEIDGVDVDSVDPDYFDDDDDDSDDDDESDDDESDDDDDSDGDDDSDDVDDPATEEEE